MVNSSLHRHALKRRRGPGCLLEVRCLRDTGWRSVGEGREGIALGRLCSCSATAGCARPPPWHLPCASRGEWQRWETPFLTSLWSDPGLDLYLTYSQTIRPYPECFLPEVACNSALPKYALETGLSPRSLDCIVKAERCMLTIDSFMTAAALRRCQRHTACTTASVQ